MKITAVNIHDKSKSIDITDCFRIDIGEGDDRISIQSREGKVEIYSAEKQLCIRPRASNLVEVELAK